MKLIKSLNKKKCSHPRKNQKNKDSDNFTVLTAIPVFNEVEYVDAVLKAVKLYSNHILVIDDGSTDGTSGLLSKHDDIEVITHSKNSGYGQSLIDAFNFAVEHNYGWLLTIDCDYQHEPSYIPRFYAAIEQGEEDVISGSRYLKKFRIRTARPPAERFLINRRITAILNEHLDLNLTDAFCGFKVYRISAVAGLKLTQKGYGFPLQFWIRARKARLRIREVAVPLIYHDPNRQFNGELNDPEIRFKYYLQVIEEELGYDVSKDAKKTLYSRR